MRQFYLFAQQEHQPAAVFFEPLDAKLIVGQDPSDFRPEAGRVIHLFPVAELMDHDVVEYFRRQLPQRVFWLRIVILP